MVYAWSQTGEMILNPLYTLWINVIDVIPSLVAAIIVIVIGWFIALILGHAVRVILEKIRVDEKVRKAKDELENPPALKPYFEHLNGEIEYFKIRLALTIIETD